MSEVYIRTDSATGIVTFIHRRPFDPVNGLGETRENLMKTGFFVSDFPEPVTTIGKKAIAYYDHERKKVYYMNRFMDMSSDDISDKLCLSKRTVENHLFIGRKEIRKYIKECI